VATGDPNAVALNSAILKANAKVDRLVGGHGAPGVGPYTDLAKAGAIPKMEMPLKPASQE
jgi:hypothetical protein